MSTKQEQILNLLNRCGEPLTAREITDALYGAGKQQSIVFGKLQEMISCGLLYKAGEHQPFYYGIKQNQSTSKTAATDPKKVDSPVASAQTLTQVITASSRQPVKIRTLIQQFFSFMQESHLDIYNEFSLQHELGIFLRKALPDYKVQFERNVSFFYQGAETIKKEIDIVIYNDQLGERYAIELKHPLNGQYPEQMYAFVKDIRFMEQLQELGFTQTFAVVLVNDRSFYSGANTSGIYHCFRSANRVYGTIRKPTGNLKGIDSINLSGNYPLDWTDAGSRKYYIIEIPYTSVE